ncbi:type II toxin-antitoxin system RelE/ParE family toxin [Phenylobacterium sp.]|uniref:type II toxin-antitoxin system RelE/ParE family toxin n=1 Tax=Phenylobacterium sp. TaxID=1871053 RepID=UPI0039C94C01
MPSANRVRFRPEARGDLLALHDYIADRSGGAVAGRYIERIETACLGLADFPIRGTRLETPGGDLRIIGFERRATIVFRLLGDDVQIVRVLYGGRDVEATLGQDPHDA